MMDFDQLWDFGQPDKTEQQFRALLDTHPADANYRLQLLTQIARAQGLQAQFEAAHETLNTVELHLTESLPTVKARYLLERGRVFNSSGQPEAARPLFEAALEAIHAATSDPDADFYAVDTLHMLAIVASGAESLTLNLRALEVAEASSSERARNWLGSLYNNIGWVYHDLGQFEDALAVFEKAVSWRVKQGKPTEIHIARWCVARTLRSLNRPEDALAILNSLEASEDGYVYEELGECNLLLGKPHQDFFARAYELLSADSWFAAHEPERLARLKLLGKVTG